MANVQVSMITLNLAKILLILGLIYLFVKIYLLAKRKDRSGEPKSKGIIITYQIHKIGSTLAVIAGIIHGITVDQSNLAAVYSGWILVIQMAILSGMGIFLGAKNGGVPFDGAKDEEFRIWRIVKWILTIMVIINLILHVLF